MGNYAEDPAWSDIVPLPIDEGGSNPLAAIAYSNEYEECMSYLRAVMAANELSLRALDLTEDLIEMNPAHYTVWLYRAKCLLAMDADLHKELAWLNEIALAHQKNYQIWHHRNMIVDKLDSCEREQEFVEQMLDKDAKNYHVWCYRQWLVRRFGLWDKGELEFVEKMLTKDVRNNSAWNHRWYVVNGREAEGVPGVLDPEIRSREVRFAQAAIQRAPQNQSPWNYLKAIVRKTGMAMDHLRGFVEEYAQLDVDSGSERVGSNDALEMLVDILVNEKQADGKAKANHALDLLASKYDPIRKNYWEYKRSDLGLTAA